MNRENPFQSLADQAKRGDAAAKTQLNRQLEPQMVRIVRRTLAERSERTSLERQIFAAARRMGLDRQPAAHEDRDFVLSVARSVCSAVVTSIPSPRNAGFLAAETVCDF